VAKAQSKAMLHVWAIIQRNLEQVYKPAEAKPAEAKADSQAVDFDKLAVLAKELGIVGTGVVVPMLQAAERLNFDQIERAYQPHIMEKELKIQAEIDRRIEKLLKRLVMAKEYKRLYGAKSGNANQIEATRLPAKSPNNPRILGQTDLIRPSIDRGGGKDTRHLYPTRAPAGRRLFVDWATVDPAGQAAASDAVSGVLFDPLGAASEGAPGI
jgi:hypothetical protein